MGSAAPSRKNPHDNPALLLRLTLTETMLFADYSLIGPVIVCDPFLEVLNFQPSLALFQRMTSSTAREDACLKLALISSRPPAQHALGWERIAGAGGETRERIITVPRVRLGCNVVASRADRAHANRNGYHMRLRLTLLYPAPIDVERHPHRLDEGHVGVGDLIHKLDGFASGFHRHIARRESVKGVGIVSRDGAKGPHGPKQNGRTGYRNAGNSGATGTDGRKNGRRIDRTLAGRVQAAVNADRRGSGDCLARDQTVDREDEARPFVAAPTAWGSISPAESESPGGNIPLSVTEYRP